MEWTYQDIMNSGNQLEDAGKQINDLINELQILIDSVKRNYESPQSAILITKFDKIRAYGPDFLREVMEASEKLKNEVAPAYLTVEKKNEKE